MRGHNNLLHPQTGHHCLQLAFWTSSTVERGWKFEKRKYKGNSVDLPQIAQNVKMRGRITDFLLLFNDILLTFLNTLFLFIKASSKHNVWPSNASFPLSVRAIKSQQLIKADELFSLQTLTSRFVLLRLFLPYRGSWTVIMCSSWPAVGWKMNDYTLGRIQSKSALMCNNWQQRSSTKKEKNRTSFKRLENCFHCLLSSFCATLEGDGGCGESN